MTKVAVLLAPGFEEIEALAPVDIFRRAGFSCEMIGLEDQEVTGSHGMTVKADGVFDGDLSSYDLVYLPGGLPGAENLRDHEGLMASLKECQAKNQWVAAICAAPIALDRAGLLEGKTYTCYPGTEKQIASGDHREDLVVLDGHLATSRGAGLALEFAYVLVDQLGGDAAALRQGMVYSSLFDR